MHDSPTQPSREKPGRPQIVIEGFAIPQRMCLRHIPGTPPAWLVGHMLRVKRRHRLFLYDMWEEMGREHGKVFKWFWGTQPVITIRGAQRRGARGSAHPSRHARASAACPVDPSARRPAGCRPRRPRPRMRNAALPRQTLSWRASCA